MLEEQLVAVQDPLHNLQYLSLLLLVDLLATGIQEEMILNPGFVFIHWVSCLLLNPLLECVKGTHP